MGESRSARAFETQRRALAAETAGTDGYAAQRVGGALFLAAATLVTLITMLTDVRHEPYPTVTRALNYGLSGVAALAGLWLVRTVRRVPLPVLNVAPSVASIMVCIPTTVDKSPTALGPLLLTWPVTFAAAVLSTRVAWVTLGVTAAAFALLAAVSRGVDGLTLWIEVTASLAVICVMVAHLQRQSGRLREALAVLARTDQLTGLTNRRGFDEALERRHRRAVYGGTSLSLLLVDIDHFKAVNDSAGHPAGDVVLRSLGALLTARVRGTDVVGRIGGEEFAVLIADWSPDQAFTRAVELCEAVRTEARAWDHPITVSIGVTTADAARTGTTELFAAADRALYAAKNAGRDRVERR